MSGDVVVRAATEADLQPLYEMAKLTGGGFTNLPADREALADKLRRSAEAFARDEPSEAEELFVVVLENARTGEVRGTAQMFTRVGQSCPFYSYRRTTVTQHSRELGRTFRNEMLSLVTDLEGSSEIGGLFVHPAERAGGLGLLLARSRYLFIAMHRERFADRILAELRGIVDERGGSAFWDGFAGRFFGMSYQEADHLNATRGNQFIADLMPKHPIYTAMLPDAARAVIGLPHPSGRAAMRMLEAEGFACEGYVDIFDSGPTMTARTDRVASVAGARAASLLPGEPGDDARLALVAGGRLAGFRCCCTAVEEADGGGLRIGQAAKALLGVGEGDAVRWVPR